MEYLTDEGGLFAVTRGLSEM